VAVRIVSRDDDVALDIWEHVVVGAEEYRKQQLRWAAFYTAAATNTGKVPE
jgi:hypothetical protein